MAEYADVLIVGAGPAGLATAIAVRLKGLSVTVADSRRPPIEKACGEGLLPEGVAALSFLGIHLNSNVLNSNVAFPVAGIRFCDETSSATGKLPQGAVSFGLRRTVLHSLLLQRAHEVGVSFRWGTRVSDCTTNTARLDGAPVGFRWLVGADGQKSNVRKWAALGPRSVRSSRFGFRRHFTIAPWSNFVEVYWGHRCQIYVTPTGSCELCVALLASDPQMRIAQALPQFPELVARLHHAQPLTTELGGVTTLDQFGKVARGNAALVGDASFTVDGITGQGLSLAFQQALHLSDALATENLAAYEVAHRALIRAPARMARLLLLLARHNWLRRRTLRILAKNPNLFASLLSSHSDKTVSHHAEPIEVLDQPCQVLRA
ncbi:MAG: NAD(P)/FAD-dependent oxidoreductase [Candidatus Acidiferrales bacterium]